MIVQAYSVEFDRHIIEAYAKTFPPDDDDVRVYFWPLSETAETVIRECGCKPLLPWDMSSAVLDVWSIYQWSQSLTGGALAGTEPAVYEGVDLAPPLRPNLAHLEPDARAQRELLMAAAIAYDVASWALAVARPSLFVLWNGWLSADRMCRLAAQEQGIPMAVTERGYFPDTFFLDRAYNERSSIASPKACEAAIDSVQLERSDEFLHRFRSNRRSVRAQAAAMSPEQVKKHLGLAPCTRLLLCAGQLETYLAATEACPGFGSISAILAALDGAIANRPDAAVLYKPHPDEAQIDLSQYRNVRRVTDIHIHSLIEAADAVVVVNSYVGIEALALGRPVIYCGHTFVNSPRLALRARNAGELSKAASDCLDGRWRPDPAAVARYVKYLATEFLIGTAPVDSDRLKKRLLDLCGPPADLDRMACLARWMAERQVFAGADNAIAHFRREYERYRHGYERLASFWGYRAYRKLKDMLKGHS